MVTITPLCHLERGNGPVWVLRTLGSNETQSREISCHPGLAAFRSEISPLRSASVEMTGAGRLFYNLRPKGATTTLSGRAAVAP